MIRTDLAIVSPKDRKVIEGIVAASPDSAFSRFVYQLSKAFKDVTPNHYIVLGYMIGYYAGSVNSYIEIQNNNTPCQRQN